MLNTTVRDVLLKAAGLIEKYGHAKWIRRNATGGLCFLGALEVAQGNDQGWSPLKHDSDLTFEASKAVSKTLGLKLDPYDARNEIVKWNNATERTGAEVIAAMRKAAEAMDKVEA